MPNRPTAGDRSRAAIMLLALATAGAQAPTQPARGPGASDETKTWADMQASQAFATRRLATSTLLHQWVDIPDGGRTIHAFVTYPAVRTKVPVVIVAHEVFGLTDSTRNTADRIAELGYITIAPDMVSGFGRGGGNVDALASSRLTSGLMTVQPDETVNAAFDAVAAWAMSLPAANGKLAIVGLSWGGGAAFRYAAGGAHDPRLKLVCVFYDVGPPAVTQGPFKTDRDNPALPVTALDVPVHGFYPGNDVRVMKSLPATKDAMAAAGKRYDPVVYEGADHAYMRVGEDPADPNPANAAAMRSSLARLKSVLATM